MNESPDSRSALPVAVLGAGFVGREHVTAYTEIGARVVGIADTVEAAADDLAQACGARAMTDYRRLLDATQPQAVSVCLPNHLHRDATLEAFKRGMHVLCEKPLAPTSSDARAMIAEAERHGLVLMTGYHHRYQEAIVRTRAALSAGAIGTVCSFRCRFAWQMRRKGTWNLRPEESGGGVLIDSGGHAIDLYRALIGEVAFVTATITRIQPTIAVEDNAIVLLEGVDGTPGVVEVSWTTPETTMELVVEGTAGTIRVDFSGLPRAWASVRQNGTWHPLHDNWPNPYAREVDQFRACIGGHISPMVDGREGLRTLLVVEAAYRAAQLGSRQRPEEP